MAKTPCEMVSRRVLSFRAENGVAVLVPADRLVGFSGVCLFRPDRGRFVFDFLGPELDEFACSYIYISLRLGGSASFVAVIPSKRQIRIVVHSYASFSTIARRWSEIKRPALVRRTSVGSMGKRLRSREESAEIRDYALELVERAFEPVYVDGFVNSFVHVGVDGRPDRTAVEPV